VIISLCSFAVALLCWSCDSPQSARELVVSLASDRAFFETLSNALQTLSAQLQVLHGSFISDLQKLSRTISLSARPAHSTTSFHPLSMITSDPSNIRIPSSVATVGRKSDLYIWREIFEIYVTAEVFEDISEAHRGERTVEDAEKRLTLFANRVVRRGLDTDFKFKHPQSQPALETFLKLNLFILNLKKVCQRFQYIHSTPIAGRLTKSASVPVC
jgi:hypothetical protein